MENKMPEGTTHVYFEDGWRKLEYGVWYFWNQDEWLETIAQCREDYVPVSGLGLESSTVSDLEMVGVVSPKMENTTESVSEEFKSEFSDKLSKFIADDITELVSKVIEKRAKLIVDEISNDLVDQTQKLKDENARLKAGINSVAELIDDSLGIAGLNFNGDIVEWSEIREGGQFEEWLIDFDTALNYKQESSDERPYA